MPRYSRDIPAPEDPDERSKWEYTRRAIHLKCPECGISPIFVPAKKVRSLWDWLTPLDGCPRCGYAYERENGYFLIAIWSVNYTVVAGLGLASILLIDHFFSFPTWALFCIVGIPMVILAMLFARHAKAIYIAMDHWFDPHQKNPDEEP